MCGATNGTNVTWTRDGMELNLKHNPNETNQRYVIEEKDENGLKYVNLRVSHFTSNYLPLRY